MLMKRGSVRPGQGLVAMTVGGAGGLASALSGQPDFGYAGMIMAVAVLLLGRCFGARVACSEEN